jgi:hypothetical protein
MGSSDGSIGSTTKIVDHGPDSQRYNIVILGDGYQSTEMTKYHNDVQNFVNTFQATPPYNDLWCGINVHRVDVTSTDSGADDPGSCGDGSSGSGASLKTYFDSTFCGDGNIRRLLTCDSVSAKNVAVAQVPQVHMTMVIVNTTEYGGSGGQVATFSTASSAAEIGLHEMGHTAFGFTDEYEYYAGCGSGETGHDNYSGGEPSEPNATINTDKTTIKWKAVLTSSDNLPTTSNADCTQCDPQGNPKAANYVGAYEGARYFHCGCFRGSFNCRMRALNNSFCGVCQKVIRDTLAPFMPAAVTLTWANPADIVYGTALGPTQLDATAPVAGTFAYTPPANTVLLAGAHTLSVFFTPDDFADFCFASATAQLNVLKATPTINWANPPDIDQGTPLDNTQLNATASWVVAGSPVTVPGTFVYTPPASTILPVGTQTLSVLFTPNDTANYNPATATVLLNVLTGYPIVMSVTFSPTTLQQGDRVQAAVTVKNDSIHPHPTQGPDPGFEYSEGDTFQTKGFPSVAGAYRIGVDLEASPYKVADLYRWGFGHTLAPGEVVLVNGYIRFHNSRENGQYFVAMIQEVNNVVQDHMGTTGITVERP